MNTQRLRQPQLLIALLLLVILVAAILFINMSSGRPNSGVRTLGIIGIVVNQEGTCVEVGQEAVVFQPNVSNTGVFCTSGVVLGKKGDCVAFNWNNFKPYVTAPREIRSLVCKTRGLHAPV